MSISFDVKAEPRQETGKGASRRLRRRGLVPAIVYGAHREPEMVSLIHNELVRHLDEEAFYSHVLDLNVAGRTDRVVLKDLQRHPAKPFILHVDFQRVSAKEKIRKVIPLRFANEDSAKGVKTGGTVARHSVEVEIICLPGDLPEYIEIDLAEMEKGDVLHWSQVPLPAGVSLAHAQDKDAPVVSMHGAQVQSEAGEDGEEGT